MAKKPTIHPHSDRQAFERLMVLLATLIQHPGVGGSAESTGSEHRDALIEVQTAMQQVANQLKIDFPENYPAIPTIRKDLQTLRRYGILEKRMYRWGYYLGTGAMNREEFQLAFHALESFAKYQGNPQARRVYRTLAKRLRGLELQQKGQFFYPVRQFLNRAIIYTDPEQMIEDGENENSLFHQLDAVEQAILQTQAVELYRNQAPYTTEKIGFIQLYPLQLIYHDIAWYLIYEEYESGHLSIGRINRFSNHCRIIPSSNRSLEQTRQNLETAHKLITRGWGLYLGEPEEQKAELQGKISLETVKVRFFPPVLSFILEGNLRHPKQQIKQGPKDKDGNLLYIDYQIKLPPRSLKEFIHWVYRYAENAQIIAPPALKKQHQQAAKSLLFRYQNPFSNP